MSFWSSLVLARSARPPVVTSASIGRFLRELFATGALVEGKNSLSCELKYGSNVDADDLPTDIVDWDESGTIGTFREYPWDRTEVFSSIRTLATDLEEQDKSVYRAHLSLGRLHPDIVSALTRNPSDERDRGLCLCDLSFRVGPELVAVLESESQAFVGWMGLSFSGPGYFSPWKYRQVREKAESIGLVHRATEVCRQAWPVPAESASKKAIANRRRLGKLWLYDDFALPLDWFWFVSETG